MTVLVLGCHLKREQLLIINGDDTYFPLW